MTSQRLISDARRRAKSLARVSGRSHQIHLDEIAVQAGRADWAAFIADPLPITESIEADSTEEPHPIERKTPDKTGEIGDRMLSMWALPAALSGLVLIGILMLSRTRIPLMVDDVNTAAFVLTMMIMMSMGVICIPAILMVAAGVMVTFPSGDNPKLSRHVVVHMWKRIGVRMAIAVVVPAAFFTLFPAIMYSVPLEDISTHEDDAQVARRIRIKGIDESWTLASSGRLLRKGREAAFVAVDQRISPPQLRARISDDKFGREIAETFRDHAILRFRGMVNCDTGRFHIRQVETADRVAGPAIASKAFTPKGGKGYVLEPDSKATVCAPDGTTA